MVAQAGTRFRASFSFRLPYLGAGDYSITIGLAEGTQEDHVQHHWADDTLFFKVTSVHTVKGLVSIPIGAITVAMLEQPVAHGAQAHA